MDDTLPIKNFRANLSEVADEVELKGKTFVVFRRSKPVFKVVPITEEEEGGTWETVIDFTENGKTKGVKAKDALKTLKRMNH